jgi:hypothetical protein
MKKRKKIRSPEERAASKARAEFQVTKIREILARRVGVEPDQLDEYIMQPSSWKT